MDNEKEIEVYDSRCIQLDEIPELQGKYKTKLMPYHRILKNDALFDTRKNQIVENPKRGSAYYTELANKKYEKVVESAKIGLKLSGLKYKSEYEALQDIVKHQAMLARDIKQGRSSTIAADFILKLCFPEIKQGNIPGNEKITPGITLQLSPEIAQKALEIMNK